jgi:RsiW-degrading membrane proteinase PrsW (M82 family)
MSYPPGPYEGSPEWPGQQPGWPAQQEPDNYLVWAILTTVLCCLPLGIVSIVYSTKVSGLWSQGRYAEAQSASENAKKWAIIAAIAGAVIGLMSAIVYFIIFAFAISNLPSTTTTTFSGY